MLQFDDQTARLLETIYQGQDVTRRRQESFDALCVASGETIVDIGSGNGMLAAELARAVGPNGEIIGIDPSAVMNRAAIERCAAFDWVRICEGEASALPVEDDHADGVVSVQVFEYLDDIPATLDEVRRVLKQGGRLVVGDIHLDSLVWFSDDPKRMRRMIEAWNHHFTEPAVPALLPPMLREAGFVVEDIRTRTVCDWFLKPDGLANMLIQLMSRHTIEHDLLPENEVMAWREEQYALAREKRFFFSLTHFVVCARKA